MANAAVFEDLVIYLVAYQDVETSQKAALETKLQENGATVSKRFSERVTHVVVQRTHAPTEADKAEGKARLRDTFQRIEQVSRCTRSSPSNSMAAAGYCAVILTTSTASPVPISCTDASVKLRC